MTPYKTPPIRLTEQPLKAFHQEPIGIN
jgi:hypothetical protein